MSGLTDEAYETDFRQAERAFDGAYTDWHKALIDEVDKNPLPPIPDTEELTAKVSAALARGELWRLYERPQVSEELLSKLAELCEAYARAELRAYARLLDRKAVPTSQAASDLRKHVDATLDDICQSKWSVAVEEISGLFECKELAERKWEYVTGFIRAFAQECPETYLRCGWLKQTHTMPHELFEFSTKDQPFTSDSRAEPVRGCADAGESPTAESEARAAEGGFPKVELAGDIKPGEAEPAPEQPASPPPVPLPNGGNGAKRGADWNATEVTRRADLLAAYKQAAGNPSNKRIYEAWNSGIHKPQFYEWVRGELPADSATTRNFERFLKEKKLPIARRPRA